MNLALALAHTAKPQPYSPDFYVATATVIPVLFLALALQGETYKNLLTIHENAVRRRLASAAKLGLRGLLMLPAAATYAQTAALLILIAGLGGETAALWSLCYGRNVVAPGLVLAAALTLTAGIGLTLLWAYARAAIGPYAPLFRAYLNLLGSALRGKQVTPADLLGLLNYLDADAEPAAAQPAATVARANQEETGTQPAAQPASPPGREPSGNGDTAERSTAIPEPGKPDAFRKAKHAK
jgi:hypothetical protein